MRNFLNTLLISSVVIFIGCGPSDPIALRIDDITVSKAEYEKARLTNQFRSQDLDEEIFLDRYVTKKLMLLEAEELGLDRDPELLYDLQIFWEQALLKSLLKEKNKNISERVQVSDAEIKAYYDRFKDSSFSSKPLSEVSGQIGILLKKEKQMQAMQQWSENLKRNSVIKVNKDIIGSK